MFEFIKFNLLKKNMIYMMVLISLSSLLVGCGKEKVYNTIIPRLIRLTEAPSHGEPIIVYDPKSKGSEAYLNLAKEVIDRNGN